MTYYKVARYLDVLTRETGAIRVVPGSHRYGEGFAEATQEGLGGGSEDIWGIPGDEVPAVAVETIPGDLVVFNQGTKHSAWGGGDRRLLRNVKDRRVGELQGLGSRRQGRGLEPRIKWLPIHPIAHLIVPKLFAHNSSKKASNEKDN